MRYSEYHVDDATGDLRHPPNYADNTPGKAGGCMFTGHTGLANFLFCDGHVKALMPLATVDQIPDGGSGMLNMWTVDNAAFATGASAVVSNLNYGQNSCH